MWQKRGLNAFILALGLLVLIFVDLSWIAPHLTRLPDNFRYTADVLSLDNFFDEKARRFEGPHISKTVFSYQVVQKKPEYWVIQNSFDVRTLSNQPIFSVRRDYFINPMNGKQVEVPGEEKRQGYLFAPHFVGDKDFYYWHVNYDAPALMKFIDREVLNGLSVNHFQAHYYADQTANLHRLPGVPETRGIETDIVLQLWIEPISGWLVQYQDHTLAYYYDRKTHVRLMPWNNFSNRYSLRSVHQHIVEARTLKWKMIFLYQWLPLSLGLLAFFSAWRGYQRWQNPQLKAWPSARLKARLRRLSGPALTVTVLLAAAVWTLFVFYSGPVEPKHFVIGISPWDDYPQRLEVIRGFKEGLAEAGFIEGKNIQYLIENPHGNLDQQIQIIQNFSHHKVNLIFTLSTMGTLIAKGIISKTPIVFAGVTYPAEANLLQATPPDKRNLVGVRDYISPEREYYYFDRLVPQVTTLGFVHHRGDPDAEIEAQHFSAMLQRRGIKLLDISVVDEEELKNLLNQQRGQFNALFLTCHDLYRQKEMAGVLASFAWDNKIPTFTCDTYSVKRGILLGYSVDSYAMGKLAGKKAALILQGAEPSWLHTLPVNVRHLIFNPDTLNWLGIAPQEVRP